MFSLISYEVGGQKTRYHDLSVQAGDFVVGLGSANGGGCVLYCRNVPANLLFTWADSNGYTRTSVWKISASGTARVEQDGQGNNWDHIFAVIRPQISHPAWKVQHFYNPSGYTAEFDVESGRIVLVQMYCTSGRLPNGIQSSGVSCEVLVNVLPEGSSSPGNSREIILRTLGSGRLTLSAEGQGILHVCFLDPAGLVLSDDFLFV